MIKELNNRGFKDQDRSIQLSGLDLFTSGDVNGVGKSAVLEAFKLALLGEIPGRAKTVDDILQFTSAEAMQVAVVADTREGPVRIERGFLSHAAQGEKRPVWINGMVRKYEEGSQWIRKTIGAVSISFDAFEFLNLPDAKKRQWIIAHSPESQRISPYGLHLMLLAKMVEKYLGCGLVRSLLASLGLASIEEMLPVQKNQNFQSLKVRLEDLFCGQEPEVGIAVKTALDSLFQRWSSSQSAEENISALLGYLKSESLRLKKSLREQTAALTGMAASSGKGVCDREIATCRNKIVAFTCRIEELARHLDNCRMRLEANQKKNERIEFLRQGIARLEKPGSEDMGAALRHMQSQLQKKQGDPVNLQETLNTLNREWNECISRLKDRDTDLQRLSSELQWKREKHDALSAANRTCPVGREIRCDTDMQPYRHALTQEVALLSEEQAKVLSEKEQEEQIMSRLRQKIEKVKRKLDQQIAANKEIQQEIDLLQAQVQTEEKARAKNKGRMNAYQEELAMLTENQEPVKLQADELATLQLKLENLSSCKREKENELESLLRQKGRADALTELHASKLQLENELALVKQLHDHLGPDGIQGELAARIAEGLETEVNAILRLIDSQYEFHLSLEGPQVEMGWNREGKVIPFKTINSAHFVIFIVPFLSALVERMARIREQDGWPTLKALCIEAESLTPENLTRLLKGLAVMREKGVLDNVLVAHYHSLHDSSQLSGFKEHILEESPAAVTGACS